jgi:hypothetical protein
MNGAQLTLPPPASWAVMGARPAVRTMSSRRLPVILQKGKLFSNLADELAWALGAAHSPWRQFLAIFADDFHHDQRFTRPATFNTDKPASR